MGQESRHSLGGCLWLRVSHKVAVKVSVRDVSISGLGWEGPMPVLTHMPVGTSQKPTFKLTCLAVAGPCWFLVKTSIPRRMGFPTGLLLTGHLLPPQQGLCVGERIGLKLKRKIVSSYSCVRSNFIQIALWPLSLNMGHSADTFSFI